MYLDKCMSMSVGLEPERPEAMPQETSNVGSKFRGRTRGNAPTVRVAQPH